MQRLLLKPKGLGLESIQSLICERKLPLVAHCARRGDKDLTWKRTVREMEDEKSNGGSRLKEDSRKIDGRSRESTRFEDGATRSRIVVGWHPNWKEAGRREKGRSRRTREHGGISSISRPK